MFFHKQELQYRAEPSKPDAVYARRLQEVLGGQYGEINVAMQYMFQAWNIHIPGKYRDLLFGIGAEELSSRPMAAAGARRLRRSGRGARAAAGRARLPRPCRGRLRRPAAGHPGDGRHPGGRNLGHAENS